MRGDATFPEVYQGVFVNYIDPSITSIVLSFIHIKFAEAAVDMGNSSVEQTTEPGLYNSWASEAFAVLSPYLLLFRVWFPLMVVLYIVRTRYLSGIRHIPGPFIASVSNFWKISAAWHQDMPRRNIRLHRKYGKLVRIGPDMISVDDPGALSTIYGFKPIYAKVYKSSLSFHHNNA